MYQSLDLFRVASDLAQHAGARTAMVARNVANADTPGYRASALPAFTEVYRNDSPQALRTNRPQHLAGSGTAVAASAMASATEPSPNGNTVSIEEQMLLAIEAQREHTRALAIYRHAMGIIRSSLGAGR